MEDSEVLKTDKDEEEKEDMECKIKDAMRSRVHHFKQQADSLTFEGVRRLMEKDLGLEKYALDVRKRFVKQCLFECLDGAVDDNASKDSGETGEKHGGSMRAEAAESPGALESKSKTKEPSSEDEEKMEESPVMGLLTGQKTTKTKTEQTQSNEKKEVPSESMIKKAMLKRASYIRANSEEVTMAGLRRLIEEDLKLDKYALDSYKKFINNILEEVVNSREASEPKKNNTVNSNEVSEPKKNNIKKNSHGKASKKESIEESLGSSDKESDEDQDEVKPKKKNDPEQKMRKSEGSTKRKRHEETKGPIKKRMKPVGTVADDNSDAEDGGNVSEDIHSQSSAEKPVKKKEVSTPAYGKRVEHLKSVIKSCGMSVPPVVYKKVKQVPENKREAQLIKELEEILSREGLLSNPSEKEIKEVRKRKERAKELEGIDMSNIVLTSRRRSTVSFVAPPKPKVTVESDGEDGDDNDEDEDDDDDDNDDEDDINDEDDDGDNDGGDDSQSEEADEEHDDDSD